MAKSDETKARAPSQDIQDFRRYVRRIEYCSMFVLAALILPAWFALPSDHSVAMGIAFGGVFSLLKFRLNARSLVRLGTGVASAGAMVTGRFLTYGLAAVVLCAAFVRDGINAYAAAAAIFLTNLVVILDALRGSRAPRPSANTAGPADKSAAA